LELIFVDNCECPVIVGIIVTAVVVIEIIVDDHNGPVVIAQRAPSPIIIAPPPTHPGRAPVPGGHPVPSQTEAPAPAAIMVSAPSPGFVGNPGPADDGQPDPVAIIIRSPVIIIDIRHPDMPVRLFINPPAVHGQLRLILIELGGEIGAGNSLAEQGVPVLTPAAEFIIPGVEAGRTRDKPAVAGYQAFILPDPERAFLPRCLERSI
jgi:hypothetical protein